MTDSANTLWTTGYFGDFKVSVTVDLANMQVAIESMANIGHIIEALQAAGVTANLAGVEPGDDVAECDTVVRRNHYDKKSQRTIPVIDLYPAWAGGFGKWRWTSFYVDTDEDKALFNQATGLDVDKLPVYESQSPLQRDEGAPKSRFEVQAPKTFKVAKTENGEREINGKQTMTYKFNGFVGTSPAPASNGNGASSDNGSKPANTKQVTLQAALYVTHKDGVRVYYIKDIDGNKYWTTHGSLIEFASEHPGKLEPDTAHKILGLGGAIATVNADTQEVTAIEAEATADADVPF